MEQGNGEDSNLLSVRDAIFQVRTQPQKTVASPAIQEAVQARIAGWVDIQGDSEGKVNILGGDSISHCEKK
jgi:hypothetical protein